MPSRLSYVWLSLKRGLGSRTAAEVLDAFGSPEAVFAADRQALTAAPCELRKTHPISSSHRQSALRFRLSYKNYGFRTSL